MNDAKSTYYEKRAQVLLKNLRSRHFSAYYCETKEDACRLALDLIPAGASVGWGGSITAEEIGLLDAVRGGNYRAIDRDTGKTPEERTNLMKQAMLADVFLTSANAISMDGELVNIDGTGNRVAAIVYGPDSVIVIAGMNKVSDNLEGAMTRARTVAAPMNSQRFSVQTPCSVTGACADCKSPQSVCNQILITRNCKPAGRIKVILVGEELGL